MGHYVKVFAVLDNDVEIFRGTAIEIENKYYDIIGSRDKIYSYVYSGKKFYDRWRFVEVESRWSEKRDPPKKKQKPTQTKHKENLEWIRFALMQPPLYMTSYHSNGQEFKKELEAEGIYFTTEKCPYKKGHYYLKRIWTTKHSQATSNA